MKSKLLIYIWLVFSSFVAFSQKRQDIVLFDFEDGSLNGWTLEGENPFYGELPVNTDGIHKWDEYKKWSRSPLGYKGKHYLESGANGGRHSNNPDGKIISPEFRISRNYLNFYLGGEVHPKVRIYLLVDGKEVKEAFGNNFYDLQLRGWDVKDFKNRKAKFVIEDRSDMRSLIRIDHIFLTDVPPPSEENWVKKDDRQSQVWYLRENFA